MTDLRLYNPQQAAGEIARLTHAMQTEAAKAVRAQEDVERLKKELAVLQHKVAAQAADIKNFNDAMVAIIYLQPSKLKPVGLEDAKQIARNAWRKP